MARWATFSAGGGDRVGVVDGDSIYARAAGETLLGLLTDGRLAAAADEARRRPAEVFALADVRLRAPVPRPSSIRDFLAFEEHIRNARGGTVDPDWYELPVFYFSNPAAVLGPEDDVPVAPGSQAWDYELEVGAVIGRAGSDLSPTQAEGHIAGLTVLCDFSARDLQRREMAQLLGPAKGKDSATSLGPVLVTMDELEDRRAGRAFSLAMTATVNDAVWSRGRLDDIYWSFGEMVAYASRGTTVVPGDVIGSGTVGTGCILELSTVHGADAYPWLRPGDEVTLEVEALGQLRHRIVEGAEVVPLR